MTDPADRDLKMARRFWNEIRDKPRTSPVENWIVLDLADAFAQARAEGRAEQRERDARVCERYGSSQGGTFKQLSESSYQRDLRQRVIAADTCAAAIREEGEE